MERIIAVVGQAGTGKTTWLMQRLNELAPQFLTSDSRRVLAITRMHGSRRRLQLKLLDSCPGIPCDVTTIESFALSLLNRWRRSLGYARVIQPVPDQAQCSDTVFGREVGFSSILVASGELLRSKTVKAVVHESYPVVLIDEFQDCHGPLLDFVKALSACSTLIVAADDFQLLDKDVAGCPAVEWLQTAAEGSYGHITRLATCHRTSVHSILDAARCLRDNAAATGETIPVLCCMGHGQAAFKILEALMFARDVWQGSTAVICPSHDDFVRQVLVSCDGQMRDKNLKPIRWFSESVGAEERRQLYECLGLDGNAPDSSGWIAPRATLGPTAGQVVTRTQRFARLRGIEHVPNAVVAHYVDEVVHERRAYGGYSPKRVVTTVHGAKNREFDNVIIIWPYKVPSAAEQKRRLLYNAITRSKRNCMLLVRGAVEKAAKDPALSLLGQPRAAFRSRSGKTPSRGVGRRERS